MPERFRYWLQKPNLESELQRRYHRRDAVKGIEAPFVRPNVEPDTYLLRTDEKTASYLLQNK